MLLPSTWSAASQDNPTDAVILDEEKYLHLAQILRQVLAFLT